MSTSAESQILAKSPLFQTSTVSWPFIDRVKMSYQRVKAILTLYKLTKEDLVNVSPKFWAMHTDYITCMDMASAAMLLCHANLCAGTIAMLSDSRPDLDVAIEKLLSFEFVGNFCLTEVGHGLDARNLETTATLLLNGGFELHTPNEAAVKFMPPTSPVGIPCLAVVFARLIYEGEDRGVRPFLLPLHDGHTMCTGITSKLLVQRNGSRPLNHSLTSFNRVQLPRTALLGSIERPTNFRQSFFDMIARVHTGTITVSVGAISGLALASYVAAKYSARRTVIDALTNKPRPILSFPTQYGPILTALAQAHVCRAFSHVAYEMYTMPDKHSTEKHFIAALYKSTVMRFAHASVIELADRCGAQGLFEVNQISILHPDLRGAAIAEGDIGTISIRFAFDILRGFIKPPAFVHPDHVLSKHESGLIENLKTTLAKHSQHRTSAVEAAVFPRCADLVHAIGVRLAYEASLLPQPDKKTIPPHLRDVFVANVIRSDAIWYSEKLGISQENQMEMERNALAAALPHIQDDLALLEIEAYTTAPMLTEESWKNHVSTMKTYTGDAVGSFEPLAKL